MYKHPKPAFPEARVSFGHVGLLLFDATLVVWFQGKPNSAIWSAPYVGTYPFYAADQGFSLSLSLSLCVM